MDQSEPLAHTQIAERRDYTQIPSAEPVSLSKSEELSVPSQNKGEIEDVRKCSILTILFIARSLPRAKKLNRCCFLFESFNTF